MSIMTESKSESSCRVGLPAHAVSSQELRILQDRLNRSSKTNKEIKNRNKKSKSVIVKVICKEMDK